jgi:uncharacterized repeat protein (TIGR02543 family)
MNNSTKRGSALGGITAAPGLSVLALVFGLVLAGCTNAYYEAEQAKKEAEEEAKIPRYTVTFNTMGGGAITEQEVKADSVVNKPADPARTGFDFAGWYYTDDRTVEWPITVTADVMVYARWSLSASIQPGWNEGTVSKGNSYQGEEGLFAALDWIKDNAKSGENYTIVLGQNETITPQNLAYTGKQVTITLVSKNPHTVTFTANPGASLFEVGANVTLYLEANVTLQGTQDNTNKSLVKVNGGRFIMNGGKITGNKTSDHGGGVYVSSGSFTLNGGEISGNTAHSGGGVYVSSGSSFTMNGGEISGNITNGINVSGSGVYVSSGSSFTMNGGTISGNTSSYYGGGVYAGTFTMNGGTISGNTSSSGGGVYANSTFTMSGGTISGNTSSYGGGVLYAGTFTKSGGIIYGSNAADELQNKASSDSYGHAVYGNSKKRNTTARANDAMDSGKDGAAGGWE